MKANKKHKLWPAQATVDKATSTAKAQATLPKSAPQNEEAQHQFWD